MLIFLDIDGVMVPAKSWKAPELSGDGFFAFSEKAVNALSNLISKKHNITIILTSSHRSNFSNQEWKDIFKRRNINIRELKCLSSFTSDILSRDQEIVNWFSFNNNINESFIILDDDNSLNNLPIPLKEHWIKIKPFVGLTSEDLKDAEHLLQEVA